MTDDDGDNDDDGDDNFCGNDDDDDHDDYDDDDDHDKGTCDSRIGRIWMADDLFCGWQPGTCQRAVQTQLIPESHVG
jgi:hypothetical protein